MNDEFLEILREALGDFFADIDYALDCRNPAWDWFDESTFIRVGKAYEIARRDGFYVVFDALRSRDVYEVCESDSVYGVAYNILVHEGALDWDEVNERLQLIGESRIAGRTNVPVRRGLFDRPSIL